MNSVTVPDVSRRAVLWPESDLSYNVPDLETTGVQFPAFMHEVDGTMLPETYGTTELFFEEYLSHDLADLPDPALEVLGDTAISLEMRTKISQPQVDESRIPSNPPSAQDWINHRAVFTQLCNTDNKGLREVRDIMIERYGFVAR